MRHIKKYGLHVDFLRNENRYYGVNGESLVMKAAHSKSQIPEKFSIESFKKVLKKIQTGKINYEEFCCETKNLGCSYYIVYINGRQVHYMGRNGEVYIEHFPNKLKQQEHFSAVCVDV